MAMKKRRNPTRMTTGFRAIRQEVNDKDNHIVEVEFPKQDGALGRLKISRETLAQPHIARLRFIGAGAADRDEWKQICKELLGTSGLPTTQRVRQSGWHGETFVTRYGVMSGPADIVLDGEEMEFQPARTSGNRSAYLKGVQPFLEKSDFLLFAYIVGLAPPLASRLERTSSFAVCFSQESSTGKTLSLRLAHSLADQAAESDLLNFGNSMGHVLDSLATLGGLCVCFTDIKADINQRNAIQKLQTLTFNATGALARQRKGEPARSRPQFLIPFLSAERPVCELFAAANISFEDGEAVRLLDIAIPPRDAGGIFAGAPENSVDLVAQLEAFLEANHGTVMPWWIKNLAHVRIDKLRKDIEKKEDIFLKSLGELLPLHTRIAKHFSLLSAVAYIATLAKVLPISHEVADSALRRIFHDYTAQLGQREAQQVAKWQEFFDLLDDERVLPRAHRGQALESAGEPKGFRRKDNGVEYIFVRRGALEGIFAGTNLLRTVVLPQLDRLGCLERQQTEDWTVPISQAGIDGRPRYYRIVAAALGHAKAKILGAR